MWQNCSVCVWPSHKQNYRMQLSGAATCHRTVASASRHALRDAPHACVLLSRTSNQDSTFRTEPTRSPSSHVNDFIQPPLRLSGSWLSPHFGGQVTDVHVPSSPSLLRIHSEYHCRRHFELQSLQHHPSHTIETMSAVARIARIDLSKTAFFVWYAILNIN